MRNRISRTARLGLLLVVLLLILGFSAAADETVPQETEPEATEPKVYTVDAESEIYKVCDDLAQTLNATQILVYDSNTDEILYTKSVESGKVYPASITKLFSCYVALQHLDPNETLVAGDELSLVQEGSSKAYIYRNQHISVRLAVEGMLLPSGNDAAMILAAAAGRRIAGDESLSASEAVLEFVKEMNRMADELGFEKSHFTSPDGYHMGAHYTSLHDLARIAKLALENPTISRYMRLVEEEVTYSSGQTNHWTNTNLLLVPESGFYRYDAIGMKTGFTRQAGYSLMSAFRYGDGALVIGVFGCPDEYARFRDVIKLANACKEVLE